MIGRLRKSVPTGINAGKTYSIGDSGRFIMKDTSPIKMRERPQVTVDIDHTVFPVSKAAFCDANLSASLANAFDSSSGSTS